MKEINKRLFDYIESSPTPYHATAKSAEMLESAGYERLSENCKWDLQKGKKYYVTRGFSSLIAFRTPECDDFHGFMLTAAHSDSPAFKVKENSLIKGKNYVKLSTERYGGMLCASWFDRPLSIAGRVTVKNGNKLSVQLVDIGETCAVIPSVAIHMNRNANEGASYNAAVDMLPLYSTDEAVKSLNSRLAEKLGINEEDILTKDLFLYNPAKGVEWAEFISIPRLDDLQCAFASLEAFITSNTAESVPVYCLFDNEEVGSLTKQGADSTFLSDVLSRVSFALLGEDRLCEKLADSFLVSCDNAHAVHPNHGELADPNHSVYMNRGIVIKYNANQKYTSDSVSAGIFRMICEGAGVPCQLYANRADMLGGSTLGNISNSHISVNSVDIGLAQLAMHSSFESAGSEDTESLISALRYFFENSVIMSKDGEYELISRSAPL